MNKSERARTVTPWIATSLIWLGTAQACLGACPATKESEAPKRRESPELYPLTAIVANADRFDGQELTTFGYFISGHEISALCPSQEVASTSECIFLTYHGADDIAASELRGRALMVMGKFSARKSRTSSFYAGRIESWRISRVPEIKNASPPDEQAPDRPNPTPDPEDSTPAAGTSEKDPGAADRH